MREREYKFIQYNGFNFEAIEEFLDGICDIVNITYSIKNNDYVGKYTNLTYPISFEYNNDNESQRIGLRLNQFLVYSKTRKRFRNYDKDDFYLNSIDLIHLNMKDCNHYIDSCMRPFLECECINMIKDNVLPTYPCYNNEYTIRMAQKNIRKAFLQYDKLFSI